MRLYIDEDAIYGEFVESLRVRGVDVLTAVEAGMIRRSDEKQLMFARAKDRVIFTYNVGDFHRLHGTWLGGGQDHSGIVAAVQQRWSLGEQLRRTMRLVSAVPHAAMKNRFEFLSSWGPRGPASPC